MPASTEDISCGEIQPERERLRNGTLDGVTHGIGTDPKMVAYPTGLAPFTARESVSRVAA